MSQDENKNTQPPFPLNLTYEPAHKQIVKQHWNMTFARQKKISPLGKRIMARVIDQIRDDDYELRPHYQFRVHDLARGTDLAEQTLFNHVKGALRELADITWEFENADGREWHIRHLLDTTKEQAVGYKDGIVTVLLNPQLEPYFIEIAHYTKYQLANYMNLKSWYSMRFFEILSAFRDVGTWSPTIEQYRQLMDCWQQKDRWGNVRKDRKGNPLMKYPNAADLMKKTISEAHHELSGTNLAFDYEPVYEQGSGRRGRPKIIALRFTLCRRLETVIPERWLENSIVARVIDSLRSWKVTDRNIALYLEDIGTAPASRLVYGWQLKETSEKRMDDRAKYCNAVFVKIGQAAQQRLRDEVRAALGQTDR